MKRLATLLITLLLTTAPVARAGVGGEVPGPDTCEYPMVGTEGMEGVVILAAYDQGCSGPTEINGSHWQTFYGGAASTTQLSAGIGIAFLTVGISAQAPTGILRGVQYWACPDMSVAEEPNPIMTWQGSSLATAPVKRSPCKPIHSKPAFLDTPPPDALLPPNPLAPQPPSEPFVPPPPPGMSDVVPVNPSPLPGTSSDVVKLP